MHNLHLKYNFSNATLLFFLKINTFSLRHVFLSIPSADSKSYCFVHFHSVLHNKATLKPFLPHFTHV